MIYFLLRTIGSTQFLSIGSPMCTIFTGCDLMRQNIRFWWVCSGLWIFHLVCRLWSSVTYVKPKWACFYEHAHTFSFVSIARKCFVSLKHSTHNFSANVQDADTRDRRVFFFFDKFADKSVFVRNQQVLSTNVHVNSRALLLWSDFNTFSKLTSNREMVLNFRGIFQYFVCRC